MFFRLLLVCVLISACEPSHDNIIRINKESIIHDNSSKIWVINKVTKKGVNYGKLKLDQKDVAVFFENGKVFFQPISTLGNYPKKFGKFFLSPDSQTLFINFGDEKWYFEVKQIRSKFIELKHMKKSDFMYDLELISYPEGQ